MKREQMLWARVRAGQAKPRKGDNPATFHQYRQLIEYGRKLKLKPGEKETANGFRSRCYKADPEVQERWNKARESTLTRMTPAERTFVAVREAERDAHATLDAVNAEETQACDTGACGIPQAAVDRVQEARCLTVALECLQDDNPQGAAAIMWLLRKAMDRV